MIINHNMKITLVVIVLTAFYIIALSKFQRTHMIMPGGVKKAFAGEENVSCNEDLMREHGALRRCLLVYEEILRRNDTGRDFPVKVLADNALLIQQFIEGYHEKLEEQYLFPKFNKNAKYAELADTLYQQHRAGRRLTEMIINLSRVEPDDQSRKQLASFIRDFIAMYRPHAAREDTVLFPALHEILTDDEYSNLGGIFEDKEKQLFGGNGFQENIASIEEMEKTLKIYSLSQFTPKDPR